MSSHDSTSKLVLSAAVAAAVVVGILVATRDGEEERGAERVAGERGAVAPDPAEELAETVDLVPPPRVKASTGVWNEPTSVLWPCKIELDLIQADYLPTMTDVPPVGTGAAARLSGRIVGSEGGATRAEVRFVAGPNEGRVLHCDATGAFGAKDLYPGLAIVEIRGEKIVGAKREVRLRANSDTQLNLGFGMTVPISGRVIDRRGEPIRGAKVEFDGREVISGIDGYFHLPAVAGGECLVAVEHPDFAALLSIYPVAAGRERQGRDLVLTLDDPVSITLSTPTPVGGPGPTLVYLLPNGPGKLARGGTQMPVLPTRYPWYQINPIEVPAGSPVVINNLPRSVFRVVAFRQGAVAREQVVNPRPGRVTPVSIRLQPAPVLTGVVTWRDEPLPGAQVTLQAPDQVRANLSYLRQPSYYLEHEVVPYFPPAHQSVLTDAEGRYNLTAWSDVTAVRYLEARGPLGSWAGRLVSAEEKRVDLDLASVELGDSALIVEMPGRTQGLPMEVTINGAPEDPYVLAPFDDFVIDKLLSGRWRLKVTWDGDPVLVVNEFTLHGEETFRVALPIGAVEGQDEEAWRRAGRSWPLGMASMTGR